MSGPLQVHEITAATDWERCVLSMPEPHILQSWAWGETKRQTGWFAKRLVWHDQESGAQPAPLSSAVWASASMLVRRLNRRLPLAVAYLPKGPLLDWTDEGLRQQVVRDVEGVARRAGALFVKIDPDVIEDSETGRAVRTLLALRGWIPSPEQIQYRNTLVSDLTPSEDELLAAMKPKWRYNIRLAERKGVVVRDGTEEHLPVFYNMYAGTGRRDGFLVRPFEYYRTIWVDFLNQGLAHLLLAEVESRPIAGLILFRYGPTAWYFYGASTSDARDLMPNHALQWAAMKWAKRQGCTRYDWWGAPDVLEDCDPMWGVYRFKQGFGGEFVAHIGAWDFPVKRGLYWAYTRAMPKVLDVMRRQRLTASQPGN